MKNDQFFTIRVLTKYFLFHLSRRPETWIICSLGLCIFSAYGANILQGISSDTFSVTSDIYGKPVFYVTVLVSVLTSLLQLIHITRDIDNRVYESYLYGPIDEFCYLASILTAYGITGFINIFLFPSVYLLCVYALTGIPVPGITILQLFTGFTISLCMLSVSLAVCAFCKTAKLAVWYILLYNLVVLAIFTVNTVIAQILVPILRTDTDLVSFLRRIFNILYSASFVFSPYTLFYFAQQISTRHPYAAYALIPGMLALSSGFFYAAVRLFRRRSA